MKVTPASWVMPPWRDAGSTWTSRDGLLVTIDVDGATGTGEASPLPGLSAESVPP